MSSGFAKMNRKQRRDYAKQINSYNKLKEFENEFIKVETEKAQRKLKKSKQEYLEILMYLTAYTISYKLGLGKKRLPEIMEAIINNIDAFNTGHLEPGDYDLIKKEVQELGFKF